jgi:diguanylate cyclase (GGDEF)-like protein/PAS domain S-box-containing protein
MLLERPTPGPAVIAANQPVPEGDMLGALLAHFDGLVYRCQIDEHWTMHYMSPGSLQLTGYTSEDFTAHRVHFETLIHPADRIGVRTMVHSALEHGGRFRLEYRIVRRDGAVRWVSEHGTGVIDAQGRYTALEGFVQDITVRHEAERALYEAERRYRSIFENAVEGIYQSAPAGGFMEVNPALARMFGYATPQELIEVHSVLEHLYVDPGRRDEFVREMQKHGQLLNFESQVRRRDGSMAWISENSRAVRGPDGELLFYEGTMVDITERKEYEARVRFQATHDALTGLPNRHLLCDRMEQAIHACARSGQQLALAFVDLDQFKFVNDSLGHQVGDALLKTVAARLLSCVRAADTVSRQGGDEFVIAFAACSGRDAVEGAVQRILAAVAEPLEAGGLDLQVTCSIGISLYPEHGTTVEELLRHADSAMYEAKAAGRNNYAFFDTRATMQAGERLTLLTGLRHALGHNQFLLHYQPRIDLGSGGVIGCEALIRWNHPQRGMVPPMQFIPLAEDSGLILAIGEWVLRTACAQNVAWQRAGMAPLPVAVNLSPRQLMQENLVDLVTDVLATTGLAPACLELEITETLLMRDVDKSLSTLHRLKQLGVAISIDDFGTGYSSLNYLKRFPVDTLKIDRSFVNDIAHDPDDAAIVKAIISLAHILQLQVVAEGVETEEQQSFLLENGCDQAQGFLFGRPQTPEDFARLCGQ